MTAPHITRDVFDMSRPSLMDLKNDVAAEISERVFAGWHSAGKQFHKPERPGDFRATLTFIKEE